MPGFNSISGDEAIMFADNASFDGTQRGGKMTTNAQLWIGSTAAPHVKLGNITSPLGTINIGYSSPNITLDLAGGTTAIDSIAVDTTTGAGTNPVLPTAAGLVTFTGGQYATGTFGTRVITINSPSANTLAVEAQISTASAAALITNNGISHFDSARFTVAATGFVSLNGSGVGETITGDSGGALSPTAGNWNILGRSGSKTSGSASTLTVKSPPYADAGGSTTSTLNSGSFVTAAVTLTLPASAGLADGDLFEYVCTTAGALIIQAVGTQKIRIGTLISSAAGTATSTNIGDSVTLRFRATDGFFYATSVIGTWLIA
jgi:hypothetical protein